MKRAGSVVLVLLWSVVPCIAQDQPAADPKPVASDHEMLRKYVWSTIGIDGAFNATISSSLDQLRTSPSEWGDGFTGLAKRWTSDYAESAIGDGTKYVVAHFFHQDPAFYPCTCTGFARRLHHAVDSPFMARRPDGTRVPSIASLSGLLAANIVPAATWYPAPLGTRGGLKHAGMSLISKIAIDIFKEFKHRARKDAP